VEHLTPRGRAFLYLQIPNERSPKLLETVRELLGRRGAIVLLEDSELDLDEYCSVHEASALITGYDDYANRVQRRREHLDRMGITSITTAYLLVINQEPAFAQAYRTSGLVWGSGSNADVEALLSGLELAHRDEAELLATALSFRGDPSIAEVDEGIRIDSPPLRPIHWDRERFGLLLAATRASSVGQLRAELQLGDELAQQLARDLCEIVREAARQGLVTPVRASTGA
jgi:hypothetical protein